MKLTDQPTAFLNVQVSAVPERDPATGKTLYHVTFHPAALVVTQFDTVINYQLVDPTPAGVRFRSVSIRPDRENQLSDPTISESGKLVTFSDANTKPANFNLTLHFTDRTQQAFQVDPEISNQPPPERLMRMTLMPEMSNNPPPEN